MRKRDFLFWADFAWLVIGIVLYKIEPEATKAAFSNFFLTLSGVILTPLNVGVSASLYVDKKKSSNAKK